MIEQPPNDPLDRCYIGACHSAGQCVHQPCRAPAPEPEHPTAGIVSLAAVLVVALSGYIVWWL